MAFRKLQSKNHGQVMRINTMGFWARGRGSERTSQKERGPVEAWLSRRKGVAHLEGSGQEAEHIIHPSLCQWGGVWDSGVALLPPLA
jgi:hypothetical protein